jgi:rabconnectin-3a
MKTLLMQRLALVRNWEFLRHDLANVGLGGERSPLRLLRRRSSLVVADLPVQTMELTMNLKSSGASSAKPLTMIQEPDANSLLDSFGF